jgi:hypothetical protein
MATTTFNDLITFSRGSNATVTGPNGLIQWAPSNLVTNSQDFEAAGWTKNSSTITANSAVAPDGTQTADTWTPTSTATTAGVRLLGSFTVTSGSIQTASIYVKSAGKRWFFLTTPSAASANDNCWFDLQNGVVGTIGSSALSATITAIGNGWYRVTTTSVAVSATNYIFVSTTTGDNTTAVTADGTGVYIWGAQLELGSTATTYNNTSVRNLLGFSEAFDNAAWTKGNSSIVTGAQANPVNSLFNAQKLMEDTATSLHRLIVAATVTAIPYTMSVYAKAAERTWVAVGNTSDGQLAHFNLANGTVGTLAGGATATITNVGSGWYRCAVTFTPTAGSRTLAIWLASADNTLTYAGNGNSGVYIYGAMLSNSASLDPYVPTPGAAPSSTAYYGPRFDYDPVTLQPRGLLIEEQRVNLVLRSEQFDNASWTKASYTVSADAGVAPDGATTADQITTTGGNGSITQTITVTASTNYVFSFYARKGTAANAKYSVYNNSGAADIIASTNYPAEFATGAWVRITVPFTTPVGCTSINVYTHRDTASAGTTLVWGAQLEAGAFATSYIPTIASTVTRSADVATITGSLFSQWYNQSAGALIVDYGAMNGAGQRISTISDGTVNNQIWLRAGTAGGNSFEVYTAGAFVAQINPPSANAGPAKIAGAFATNDFAASVNGSAVGTDTSGALASYNRMTIGSNFDATVGFINGHIRSIRYVPVRAADFQLQQVTT